MTKLISTIIKCAVALVIAAAVAWGVNWGIAKACGEGPFDRVFSFITRIADDETQDELAPEQSEGEESFDIEQNQDDETEQ